MTNERKPTERHLAIEIRAIASLKANPRNARTHSKKQVQAILESVKTFGFTNPILIDDDDMILAGHGRFQAAKLLGLDSVPTIKISDLSEAQKRAYVLADNKLAERAGWDRDMLMTELGELSVILPKLNLSVDVTGFEVPEIDVLLADAEGEKAASQDDEVGEVPVTPVTQLGDMWTLGRHRILCADARDPNEVSILVAGEPFPRMLFTDPPFNCPVDGHVMGNGRVKHADFAMASGEMSDEQYTDFLRQALENAVNVSESGALHYVCMDWRHIGNLVEAGKSIYSELKNICVWAKSNGGQGSLYRSQHELIAVFKVGDAPHVNNVELGRFGRNRSNVWHYAGINGFKAGRQEELAMHPTVKPVALVADAIKDVTRRGDVVLDPFGGSGTTLIAAERTGRRALLMEIEPRYVDVTVQRYQALTKADAIHYYTGKTFAEVADERRRTAA